MVWGKWEQQPRIWRGRLVPGRVVSLAVRMHGGGGHLRARRANRHSGGRSSQRNLHPRHGLWKSQLCRYWPTHKRFVLLGVHLHGRGCSLHPRVCRADCDRRHHRLDDPRRSDGCRRGCYVPVRLGVLDGRRCRGERTARGSRRNDERRRELGSGLQSSLRRVHPLRSLVPLTVRVHRRGRVGDPRPNTFWIGRGGTRGGPQLHRRRRELDNANPSYWNRTPLCRLMCLELRLRGDRL